jgi:hypothetical protein
MQAALQKYIGLGLLIGCLTFFVGHVYFHSGFPYTHDGENHLARFANYAIAVREGQFPPRFAPNLMNHYGYPAFNFNYPLANILSLPFSVLKLNYEVSFKILALSAIGFGCLGSFLWLQRLGFQKKTQVLGMFVFSANMYLTNTVVFRGNIGEILTISLFPWMFWMIERVLRSSTKTLTTVLAVGLFSAFLLSHNIAVIFSLPILVSYAVIRSVNIDRNKLWRLCAIFGAAIGLTLWFWLPAIMEKSFTVVDEVGVNTAFFDHFPSLSQLLFSPLRFGFSFPGPIDSLSFGLGLLQIACFFLGLIQVSYLVWKKGSRVFRDDNSRIFIWALIILSGLFLFQLQVTQPLWKLIFPVAKYLQFPWRLSLFWGVLILPLFAFVWEEAHGAIKLFLMCILIGQLISLSRVTSVDYFHRQIEDYNFFAQSTSTMNENRSRTFTFTDLGGWQPTPQMLDGDAEISVQYWRGSRRAYDLTVHSAVTVVEPTMNFIGWQTKANGQLVNYLNSDQIGGRIAYHLPVGEYHIQTEFTQWTWPRIIGNGVGIVTSLCILGWICFSRYKYVQR